MRVSALRTGCLIVFISLELLFCSPAWCAKPAHEQQWIANSVAGDITQMILFAGQKNGKEIQLDSIVCDTTELADASPAFQCALKWSDGKEQTDSEKITLSEYIWSTAGYAPFVLGVMKKLELKSPTQQAKAPEDMVRILADYDADTMSEQNRAVSRALSQNPLDANLHEQAALLCACLALRESAACFSDMRPALNRICAHLSIARALRGDEPFSNCGQVADIALSCLCGREQAALDAIDALQKTKPGSAEQSWLRALKTRATHDFRCVDQDNAMAVERFEYGRALARDLGSDALTDYLEKHKEAHPPIDWMRIGLRGMTSSVEAGHLYAEPGVNAEWADLARDYQLWRPGKATPTAANLVASLNESATGALVHESDWSLQPISWGVLANFHARHLLDAVFQQVNFEQRRWGVPDQAAQTCARADQAFSGLSLYPLCKMRLLQTMWNDRPDTKPLQDRSLIEKLRTLTETEPQSVNKELWDAANECENTKDVIAASATFFAPNKVLFGTTYDSDNRIYRENFDLHALEGFCKLAPYDTQALYSFAKSKYAEHPTGDQWAQVCSNICDYDLQIMNIIADAYKDDPAKYASKLEKLAQYSPNYYFQLGDALRNVDAKQAVAAYEKGIKSSRDAVLMSNSCGWIVQYYFDHGQTQRALEIAKNCAEVYSQLGLCTLAYLYDRMGKLSEAEAVYKQAAERYAQPAVLAGFYLRHQTQNPQYKAKIDSMPLFKHGLQRVRLADLSGAPQSGVRITSDCDLSRKYGLKEGEIIVALDGVRIESEAEYLAAREMDPGRTSIELFFWDGKAYRSAKGDVPGRRFGFEMADFVAGGAKE